MQKCHSKLCISRWSRDLKLFQSEKCWNVKSFTSMLHSLNPIDPLRRFVQQVEAWELSWAIQPLSEPNILPNYFPFIVVHNHNVSPHSGMAHELMQILVIVSKLHQRTRTTLVTMDDGKTWNGRLLPLETSSGGIWGKTGRWGLSLPMKIYSPNSPCPLERSNRIVAYL